MFIREQMPIYFSEFSIEFLHAAYARPRSRQSWQSFSCYLYGA